MDSSALLAAPAPIANPSAEFSTAAVTGSWRETMPGTPSVRANQAIFTDWTTAINQVGKSMTIEQTAHSQKKRCFGGDPGTELKNLVASSGQLVASTAAQNMQAMTSGLSYETLIEGFLLPGEIVDGECSMLDYTSLNTFNVGSTDVKTLPAGKALLTNRRLILVSCQPNLLCDFEQIGSAPRQYKLSYDAANSISYTSIPLVNFRDMSMKVETKSHAESTVQKGDEACSCLHDLTCGLLESICPNPFTAFGPYVTAENIRYLDLDYCGAWGEQSKKHLKLNIHQGLQIPAIQQWAAHFQGCCPSIAGRQ